MNKTEHLLTCLMEECAEIQQAAAKALRFGLKDGYPGSETTNSEDIALEINDLIAVIDMCIDEDIIKPPEKAKELCLAKQDKVGQFMEYAKTTGALAG